MNIKYLILILAQSLPAIIICLVAGVVIVTKRQKSSIGSMWALLGFGLAFIMPFMTMIVAFWVNQGGAGASQDRMWAFSALSIVGSIAQAVVYFCLLLAILAGSSKSDAA